MTTWQIVLRKHSTQSHWRDTRDIWACRETTLQSRNQGGNRNWSKWTNQTTNRSWRLQGKNGRKSTLNLGQIEGYTGRKSSTLVLFCMHQCCKVVELSSGET